MFLTTNCTKAQTGVIKIKNVKASLMEELIKYMYLGKLNNFDPISIELFKGMFYWLIFDWFTL
jgi:hypothetical protein